ncbi:MAG: hypothetical protein WC817_00020 [Patescibacteria group bacterium]|jgi:hypothetical protein
MNEEQTTQEILTIVQFLKDNMASKTDLEDRVSGLVTKSDLELQVGGLATQDSLKELSGDITQALDDQMVILERLDQERLFTIERIKRIETDVAELKLRLKMV